MGYRKTGVISAALIGLSSIVGSTVFIITGIPIALAGGYSLLAILLVGVVILIVATQFAELSSLMPRERGGAYSYVTIAFGSELGFITGILLYFAFCTIISAIAVGFGSYLSTIIGLAVEPASVIFSIIFIIVIAVLNIVGIREATKTTKLFMLVLLAVLVIFIIYSLYKGGIVLGNLTGNYNQQGIGAFFAAGVSMIFAYAGFQSITALGPEVEDPHTKIPKAILLSVFIAIILYFLAAVALIMLFPSSRFPITSAPFLFVLKAVKAPLSLIVFVTLGAFLALISAAITQVFAASRLLYQMGVDGLLPSFFRRTNRNTDVAANGVVLSAVISIVMLFSGNIYTIAAISNFGLLFSWLMGSFAVINFRRKRRFSTFKAPFYPILSIIAILMSLLFLSQMPRISLSIGVAIIMVLLIIYHFIVEVKQRQVHHIRLFD